MANNIPQEGHRLEETIHRPGKKPMGSQRTNPSETPRSGRNDDLLKCSIERSIGDGTQVWAFKDPWIPHPRSFQSITRRANDDRWQGERQRMVGADTMIRMGFIVLRVVIHWRGRFRLMREYQAQPNWFIGGRAYGILLCHQREEFETLEHALFYYFGLIPIWHRLGQPTRWLPPPSESFALASDASVVLGRSFIGLGGVIRDAASVVWLVWSNGVLGNFPLMWQNCLELDWG
uniref:Uncharacterized protein n=1 Tax=Cannabis sativa TaxID=3483 RepID=A0A803QK46_CANSA